MKSIKEKSNEYADKQDLRMAYNGSCDNCRQGFVVGANYVFETIEKECKRVAQLCKSHVENPIDEEDKIDSWARLDEMEYMLKFIEQLKK